MKCKYTDKERRDAIRACALMASSNDERHRDEHVAYFGYAIDVNCRAADLARAALWAVPHRLHGGEHGRARWAEAEALLRDGWSPGDELQIAVLPAPQPEHAPTLDGTPGVP